MSSNDLKKPQMTSNDPEVKTVKSRNKLKGGANREKNDKKLDETLHNNKILLDLAMQIICNDQTVRSNTVQDLNDFNSQSLATQAKKREQLFSMMPAIKKAFDLRGDDIVELSTENDALNDNMGSYDEK